MLVDRDRRMARIKQLLDDVDQGGSQSATVNTTDADSRIMHTRQGVIQGYNAQVVCGEGQLVLAAAVSTDCNDYQQLMPMLDALTEALLGCGHDGRLGTVLADAGYFSADNIAALEQRDVEALIATTKRHKQPDEVPPVDPATTAEIAAAYATERAIIDEQDAAERERKAAIFERIEREGLPLRDHLDDLGMSLARAYVQRNNWRAGGVNAIGVCYRATATPKPRQPTAAEQARDAMDARLADPATRAHYKQRSHLVETTFGALKHNRHVTRFQRRGLGAVNAEWRLHAVAHNMSKLVKALAGGAQLAPN